MEKKVYEIKTCDGSVFVKCEPTSADNVIKMTKDAGLFNMANTAKFAGEVNPDSVDETIWDVYPKVHVLCFDDDEIDGRKVCVVRESQFGTEELRKDLTDILGEQLGLSEDDDADVLADFNHMIDNLVAGHSGEWMGNDVYYDLLDVI